MSLPILKIKPQAVQKRILSAHYFPRSAASTFAVSASPSHCRGAHRHRAAGRRPAGLRQFLQLPGRAQETRRTQASRPGGRDIVRDGTAGTRRRQEGSPREVRAAGLRVRRRLAGRSAHHVYDATGRIASSRVSTGQAGYRTPTGVFSVIGKSRYHVEHLQRRAHAVDAAHHLVGHRHARRRRAGLSRLARLHPPAVFVRAASCST